MGEDLTVQDHSEEELIGPDGEIIETSREMSRAVEAAAVRPGDESLTSPRSAEEVDAALRERPSKPPLTESEIAQLTAHRGMRPTKEEIDGINTARAAGLHTGIS